MSELSKRRIRVADILREAAAGIVQRPGRSALTSMGTVLGLATLVAVVGLTASANARISEKFNELSATEVHVEQASAQEEVAGPNPFPSNAEQRVAQLNGVASSGVYSVLEGLHVSFALPGNPPGWKSMGELTVYAVTPQFWEAVHPVVRGRVFDDALGERPVAVVSAAIASRMTEAGVLDHHDVIRIGGLSFQVIGVQEDSARFPESLVSIVVPYDVAESVWGRPEAGVVAARGMVVETDLGAAGAVARQLAVALRPDAPENFDVAEPIEPTRLKESVSADLQFLFLGSALVLLIVGMAGIANVTYVSVLERIPEIGLRRAVGALRRHVTLQFLTEAAIIGLLGGMLGGLIGVSSVVGVCFFQGWTAVIPSWSYWAGPAVGSLTGLLAGLLPSMRAARIEPVEAFRR